MRGSSGCGVEHGRGRRAAPGDVRPTAGWARRRRELAELSRLVRLGVPAPHLFADAAGDVARALGVEAACVLERVDDRGTLLLRAGTGWMAALAGRAVLTLRPWPGGAGEGAVLGVDTGRSALFRRHDVRRGTAAVVAGCRGPVGLVGAFGGRPGPHGADFLAAAAALVAVAVERRREERERLGAISRAIRDEERDRIARDLHDEPLQALAAAALAAQRLRSHLERTPALTILDQVDRNLRLAEDRMRAAIVGRRTPEPESLHGLTTALARLLAGLNADCGVRGELEAQISRELPGGIGRTLYGVAREAVANVRRHAAAATVRISLSEAENGITLRVTDDGRGFAAAPGPGHVGLRCLHERVEAAGGRCRVTSRPGRGTTVECWLPCRPGSPRP